MGKRPRETTFSLPALLNLGAAPSLMAQLRAKRGADLAIDASQVEHLGAPCLQVLLSARVTWGAEHRSLRIVNRSDAFDHALSLFGSPELETAS